MSGQDMINTKFITYFVNTERDRGQRSMCVGEKGSVVTFKGQTLNVRLNSKTY